MIDEYEYPEMKHITMTMTGGDEEVSISQTYSNDATWPTIAGQFYKFLAGMGYILDADAVSASWSE